MPISICNGKNRLNIKKNELIERGRSL